MKLVLVNSTYISIVLLLALPSCMNVKPLQFQKVENIKISKTNGQQQLNFDLVGYNPNEKGFKVKKLNAMVKLDSSTVAEIHFDKIIRLKGGADFSFTASVSMSQGDLIRIASSGLSMFLSGEKTPLQVQGDFILKKSLFRKKFSFNLNENIDPKMLKSFF